MKVPSLVATCFFKIFLICIYREGAVSERVECWFPWSPEEGGARLLELELEVVMNHSMCALATELESFGRTVQVAEPSPQAPRLLFLTILLSITKTYF